MTRRGGLPTRDLDPAGARGAGYTLSTVGKGTNSIFTEQIRSWYGVGASLVLIW